MRSTAGHVRRYMRKPWEPEVLRAELRDAIDLYNLNTRVKQLEQRLLETERAYSVSVVASGLAEELRNPVGWIRNNLTVIETSVAAATAALEEATPECAACARDSGAGRERGHRRTRWGEADSGAHRGDGEGARGSGSRNRRFGGRRSCSASQGGEQRASRARLDRGQRQVSSRR